MIAVDQFGNVQLAAPGDALASWGDALLVGGEPARRARTFADGTGGQLLVYADSANRLAVAVNGASAAHALRVSPGDVLHLTPARAAEPG